MSKVNAPLSLYAPIREERTRTVVSYDLQPADSATVPDASPSGIWHELYFYHRLDGRPTLAQIKAAITADINRRVTDRITATLTWNGKPVWLSTENQMDWKAAYDRAVQTDGAPLPQKFKLGEDADGLPVYHTFTSLNAFSDFTDTWQQHIQQCLADGWQMKDTMDWSVYTTGATVPDGSPSGQ